MARFRKLKGLVFLFIFMVVFAFGFGLVSSQPVKAARCCWVMVCTVNPPIYCWEECRPCPTFP